MNEIVKTNFLNQLEENSDILVSYILKNKKKIESSNSNSYIVRNDKGDLISSISWNINSGDIRSIALHVFTKNELKRVENFVIELRDFSIGSGLYTRIPSDYKDKFEKGERHHPFCWQNVSFKHSQEKNLIKVKTKRDRYGEKIEFTSEIDEVLSTLYEMFFRTKDDLEKYYTKKNKDNRIRTYHSNKFEYRELLKEEDLKYIKAKPEVFISFPT